MTIEKLLKKRQELHSELEAITNQILNYKDGFDYEVIVRNHDSHSKHVFNNSHVAIELTQECNFENEYAHLYTNNPDIKISIQNGNVYFIQDTSKITASFHPEEVVIILD